MTEHTLIKQNFADPCYAIVRCLFMVQVVTAFQPCHECTLGLQKEADVFHCCLAPDCSILLSGGQIRRAFAKESETVVGLGQHFS